MAILLDVPTYPTITLPEGMTWKNEFSYTPIQQSVSRSVTGSQFVDSAVKIKGRPIVISGEDDSGWITRAVLETLYARLDDNAEMTLTLEDSRTFTVKFDHSNTPIISAPVIDFELMELTDFYTLELKFIVV